MWSTEFSKFQEQYAPTEMMLGISSLACSSTTSNSASDTTASMATTSTHRTQNLTDRNISNDVDKGNKVSEDLSSATNSNVMTVAEGKEMHERAKQHLEVRVPMYQNDGFGAFIQMTLLLLLLLSFSFLNILYF